MAKKKTGATPRPSETQAQAVQNAPGQPTDPRVNNGLAGAVGYGSAFPFNQGAPGTAQVESVNTTFVNLRYYLVSNFRQILNQMYAELGLVQTIVDVPVDDALKGGVIIKSKELDEDEIEKLESAIDRDNDLYKIGQAAKWNRLFGGAGVLILTDQDPSTPLDIASINENTPLEFRPVDMWELFYDQQNLEGFDAELGEQEFEFYNYYGVKVHKSRVKPMKGIEPPSFIRPRLRGWGLSVVETLVRSLNQYLKATALGFEVLDEFKVDVYKVKNLVNTLMSANGEDKVRRRIQLTNWMKNFQNAVVMDSEDDFDHKQLSFAGLGEAMAGIRMQVASDMRMPLTKLFGISAAGFNSGEDDIEVYNAMVESQVRGKIKYIILAMIEIKCQKMFGYIPEDLSIEFEPLREMTSEQEENVKTQQYNRLMAAKSAGEITTHEFREACNKHNLLGITLDTSGDTLNPDDPDVADLLSGADVVDGDPGANDASSEDSKAKGEGEEQDVKSPGAKAKGGKTQPKAAPEAKLPKIANRLTEAQKNSIQKFGNSIEYDKAAYVADGGLDRIDIKRAAFVKDESLYQECFALAKTVFTGNDVAGFALWLYKKAGGKI